MKRSGMETFGVRRVILNLVNELDRESQEVQKAATGKMQENLKQKAA